MTEVSINGAAYKIQYSMLVVVRSKSLVGKGFFQLASKETVGAELDAETAFDKVLDLLLLGLQTHHADEFKTVEDVARILPSMGAVMELTPVINTELTKFLAVDESLRKQLADAQNAEAKDPPKKPQRSTISPKTDTPQNAESDSVLM